MHYLLTIYVLKERRQGVLSRHARGAVAFFSCLGLVLFIKYILITPITGDSIDFLYRYAYTNSDSYDWIANGVRLFENTDISFRNPGLVALIKLLDRLQSLYILPLLNQLAFLGTAIVIWLAVKKLSGRAYPAYILVLVLFLTQGMHDQANLLLADIYAMFFIALGIWQLLEKHWYMALGLLGISALFQNFAFFLMPLWIFYVAFNTGKLQDLRVVLDSKNLADKLRRLRGLLFWMMNALLLSLNLNLFWFAYKYVLFGNPLYSQVSQFELLKPNLDSLLYYFVNSLGLVGLTSVVLLLLLIWRSPLVWGRKEYWLLSLNFLISFVFWIIIYDWDDRRFLLYLLPSAWMLFGLLWPADALDRILLNNLNYLHKGALILLASGFLAYPAIVSTDPGYHLLPILPSKYLEFSVKVDPIDDSTTITQPVTVRTGGVGRLGWLVPPFAYYMSNSAQYRTSYNGTYYSHSQLLKSGLRPEKMTICTDGMAFDEYQLRSALLIEYNLFLQDLQIVDACN